VKRTTLFFNFVFSFLGGLLLLFIVLPLVSTLLGTTPEQFWLALTDPEVLRSLGLTFSAARCTPKP
jgi:ABC-type sulfate transport system permease component